MAPVSIDEPLTVALFMQLNIAPLDIFPTNPPILANSAEISPEIDISSNVPVSSLHKPPILTNEIDVDLTIIFSRFKLEILPETFVKIPELTLSDTIDRFDILWFNPFNIPVNSNPFQSIPFKSKSFDKK